jgi:hypothetical protein
MATDERRIMALTGAGALDFLQGLVTNDVRPLARGPGLVWTALLTPQGKYLSDFFVAATAEGALLLDLPETQAEAVLTRLAMYRLRAAVAWAPAGRGLRRGLGPPHRGALPDPRHPALGWRAYPVAPVPGGAAAGAAGAEPDAAAIDWDAIRVAHLIPAAGRELLPGESYILEHGFERLHGVDFRKGCYVGQEVTARMKHKTELRKGLVRVAVEGPAREGAEILSAGRPAGRLGTVAGDRALAWLRFDRSEALTAGAARLVLEATAD